MSKSEWHCIESGWWNKPLCHPSVSLVRPNPTTIREPANRPRLVTMAAIAAPLAPRLLAPSIPSINRWATFYTTRFAPKLFPTLAIALPGISLNIPQLLDDIWGGILKAVPKNKTSHSRKRHRQMAGKALEDVNHLCKCPGCGATKRTHRLCQRCLEGQ